MATAPKSQVYITAKSLDIRSISAPNTFSAYGSLSTMPMRMLRLRASSITFTPSVCPTPNYSVLTRHGHYDNYPNSICKCNARLWVACLREYLAELSIPNLVGRFPVQDLHGGVVDLVHDGLQVLVRQAVETGFLGQVAADASVAVLVRAALV